MDNILKAFRRGIIALSAALALTACATATTQQQPQIAASPSPVSKADIITVEGNRFIKRGEPYNFVGVNFWFGAYLAADGEIGDLERLRRELDLLKSLGVTNLRVLASSEVSPMSDSVTPSFRDRGSEYNGNLLVGLDRLLVELNARDMHAVLYLNNFWEWSGGMGTYLYWVNGGTFVDGPSDPEHPWPGYPIFAKDFYANEQANELFRHYVRAVVSRTNSISGIAYENDPAIMSWQLANEPRPGDNHEAGTTNMPAFQSWIDDTAALIKSIDPNHLVSTGNEGWMGCGMIDSCALEAHDGADIDYMTIHIWPFNWGWFKYEDMDGTIGSSLEKTADYIAKHRAQAIALGKPLVIEEFGLPRDGGEIGPGASTEYRNRFLGVVYQAVESDLAQGGPLVGTNVWSWGGYGRAEHGDGEWRSGDTSYTGDPPQEPQGLNSIFDTDDATLQLMKQHGETIEELSAGR